MDSPPSRSKELILEGHAFRLFGDSEYFEGASEQAIPHLAPVCSKLEKGCVCLDVGANIGLTAFFMSNHVPEGAVYAFEPVPATYADLVAGIEYNSLSNVHAYNLALGENTRTVIFRDIPKFSSGNFQILPGSENSRLLPLVEVQSVPLDAFVAIVGLERVDLIKIDVEGFELDVLNGSRRTLQRFRPDVVLEFNHFCLTTQRETSPLDAIRTIMLEFPSVKYFDKEAKAYRRIATEVEMMNFLRMHMLQTQVDDLLCSFSLD